MKIIANTIYLIVIFCVSTVVLSWALGYLGYGAILSPAFGFIASLLFSAYVAFSIKSHSKLLQIALLLSFLLLLQFSLIGISSRLTSPEKIVIFEEPVHYQMVEPVSKDFVRSTFESIVAQNKIIRLKSGASFWISKKERKMLWPESPFQMSNKGYTILATIKARPLVFGGYTDAKLVSYKKIPGKPMITK